MIIKRDFKPTRLFELQSEYAVYVCPCHSNLIKKVKRHNVTFYTTEEDSIHKMTDIIKNCEYLVMKSIFVIKNPNMDIPSVMSKMDYKIVTEDEFLGVLSNILAQSQSAARKEADIQELPHHYATRWENDPDVPRHFVTSMYMATQDSAHTRCPRYSAVQEVQPNLPVYMAVPMVLHPRVKDVYYPIQPLPPLCDDPTNPWFYINDCRRHYDDPPTQLPVPRCIIRGDTTTYSQCPIMKDDALVNSATSLAASYVKKENLIGLSCHALIQLFAGSIKHSAQIRDYIRSLVNKVRKGHKPRIKHSDMSLHPSQVKVGVSERLEKDAELVNIPLASDISRPIDPNWLLDYDEMSKLTTDPAACVQEPLLMFTEPADNQRKCDDMIVVKTTGRTSAPISLFVRIPGRFRTTYDFLMLITEYLALCRKVRSEKESFRRDPRSWEQRMQAEINRKKKNDDLGISNRTRFARIRLREDRAPGNCGVCNIDFKSYYEHIRSTAHLRRYDRLLEQYGLKTPLLETHAFFNKRQAVMSQLSHIATGVALRCGDSVHMNANGVCSNDITGVAAYKDSAACLSEVLRSNVFRCDFRVDQYDIPHASSPTCRNEDFQRWRETVFSSRQKAADALLESVISNTTGEGDNAVLQAVKQIAPSVALASLLITREREISMAISSGKVISNIFGFDSVDSNKVRKLDFEKLNREAQESNTEENQRSRYEANSFGKFISLANAIVVSMDKKEGNTNNLSSSSSSSSIVSVSKGEECIIWPEYLHYLPSVSRRLRDMHTPPPPTFNISSQTEWYAKPDSNNTPRSVSIMSTQQTQQTSLPSTGANPTIGFVSIANSTLENNEEAIPGTLGAVLGRAEVGLPIRLPGTCEGNPASVISNGGNNGGGSGSNLNYIPVNNAADVGQNQTASTFPLITKDGCEFFRKTRDGILENGTFVTNEKALDDKATPLTNISIDNAQKTSDGEDRLIIPRLFSKTHSVFTPICTYAFGDVSNVDNEVISGSVVAEGRSVKGVILSSDNNGNKSNNRNNNNSINDNVEIRTDEKSLISICGEKIHVLADEIREQQSEDTIVASSSSAPSQSDEIQQTGIMVGNNNINNNNDENNDLAILKALMQVPSEFAAELTDPAIHPKQKGKKKEKSIITRMSRSSRSSSASIIRPLHLYIGSSDKEEHQARSNSVTMVHKTGRRGYYDFLPLSQEQITMRLAEAEGESSGNAERVMLPTIGTMLEDDYSDKHDTKLENSLSEAIATDKTGLVSPCPSLDLSTAVDAVGCSLWLRYLGGTDAGALACHIRNAAADSINGTAIAQPSGPGTHVSVDIWSGILASLLTERSVLRNSRTGASPMYIESRTVRRSMARGGIPQFKE